MRFLLVINVSYLTLTIGLMHGWVDQFGCHTSQFCLVVAIAMPKSLYKFLNLLKWIWFKDPNLNIYMMHKIILQYKKNCT